MAWPAFAQVSGTVVDAANQPVAGAKVTLKATNTTTTTAADGTYSLANASGTALIIVAAKKGFFNASKTVDSPATALQIQLTPVPQDNDPDYVFFNPTFCDDCHHDQYNEWKGSPMANAGLNRWVYDIFDGTGTTGGSKGFVYTRDSVHAKTSPASECAACHQPERWVKKPHSALGPIAQPTAQMLHGISCEMCHKIANIDETKPNYPGMWAGVVTLTRPISPSNEVQYGVLGDVDYNRYFMRSSYQPQLSAAICAACHQDKNDPDGDGNFEQGNGVISEPTYLEWLGSPYGDKTSAKYTTCVGCHMPVVKGGRVSHSELIKRPDGHVRSHRIEGTTAQYLDNAVTLRLNAEIRGKQIVVSVTIDNDKTGHHVPTGVTIRNMILLVSATRTSDQLALDDVGGQTVHALGGVGDPAKGYYAGLPGKLYAKINRDAAGKEAVFFTDATAIKLDNRIAALASDTTTYRFELPDDATDGAKYSVRARLIYRRSWRALVDAKGWTTDGHGNPLEDLAPPHYGHLMESATVEVQGAGCDGAPCSSSDAGGPADAATDAASSADGGGSSDGGGCACSTAAPIPSATALAFAIIVLLGWRRRSSSR